MRLFCCLLFNCLALLALGCGGSQESGGDIGATKTPELAQASDSGLQQKTPEPAPTDESNPQKVSANNSISVKLLMPGEEPHAVLRHLFEVNQTAKAVVDKSTEIRIQQGGRKQPTRRTPTQQTTLTITGKGLTSDGDLQCEFKVDAVEVLTKPGDLPALVNSMKKSLNETLGTTGVATITSRGMSSDVRIILPAKMSPRLRASVDSIKGIFADLLIPLPMEPVGIGARWEVTQPMETPQIKYTQIARYTLVHREGDKLTLEMSVEHLAPKQEVPSPNSAKLMLESLTTSGTGTIETQLSSIVPTSAFTLDTTNVISTNGLITTTNLLIETKIHP